MQISKEAYDEYMNQARIIIMLKEKIARAEEVILERDHLILVESNKVRALNAAMVMFEREIARVNREIRSIKNRDSIALAT